MTGPPLGFGSSSFPGATPARRGVSPSRHEMVSLSRLASTLVRTVLAYQRCFLVHPGASHIQLGLAVATSRSMPGSRPNGLPLSRRTGQTTLHTLASTWSVFCVAAWYPRQLLHLSTVCSMFHLRPQHLHSHQAATRQTASCMVGHDYDSAPHRFVHSSPPIGLMIRA
jgi:hypothetical protein